MSKNKSVIFRLACRISVFLFAALFFTFPVFSEELQNSEERLSYHFRTGDKCWSRFEPENNSQKTYPLPRCPEKNQDEYIADFNEHKRVFIGIGLPAVSYNFGTNTVGFISSISPIMLGIRWSRHTNVYHNYEQQPGDPMGVYTYKPILSNISYFSAVGFGFDAGFDLDSGNATTEFGISVIPIGIDIDDISIGLGVQFLTIKGKFSGTILDHMSVVIPVTYSFSIE